jgi:salicylate hydroxylase
MSAAPIIIAGGGIGGIATALCLRSAGLPYVLLEQAAAFGEIGAGIQLSANAMRLLGRLSLAEQVLAIGVRPSGLDVRSWQTGTRILWTPLGETAERKFGAPYVHVHRADLLGLMVRALRTGDVRFGTRVRAVEQDDDGVRVLLEGGGSVAGTALIGVDGIHSVIRRQLFGDGRPRYSGNVAWRGTLPASRIAHFGLEPMSSAWWGPQRSIVHYFISAGRTMNWIGIGRAPESGRESWTETGTVADALAEFAGWHPQVREMIAATERLNRMPLYDREPLPAWTRGRVALLGDAAHAMLPFHAQGAAQSIEDAWVLSACLAARPDDPAAALRRYEAVRKPRADWVQAFSRQAEDLFHMADPAAVARRDARLAENQRRYPDGFPEGQIRLYAYDPDAALQAAG